MQSMFNELRNLFYSCIFNASDRLIRLIERVCMSAAKEIGCKSDAYACSHAPPGDVDLDVAVVGEQH